MQKLPNGKFKTTNDKVSDFRQTFKYKFITPEDELNRYKHNVEKDEDDYKESNKKKSKKGEWTMHQWKCYNILILFRHHFEMRYYFIQFSKFVQLSD